MKVYAFKPDARIAIEDAGLTQTEIAQAAGITRFHFNKRLNGNGNLMPATANKIANVFAAATHNTKAAAMAMLFTELDDGREAKRKEHSESR